MTRKARVFRFASSSLSVSSFACDMPWLAGVALCHANGGCAGTESMQHSTATSDARPIVNSCNNLVDLIAWPPFSHVHQADVNLDSCWFIGAYPVV
jgi:hypothetical protein